MYHQSYQSICAVLCTFLLALSAEMQGKNRDIEIYSIRFFPSSHPAYHDQVLPPCPDMLGAKVMHPFTGAAIHQSRLFSGGHLAGVPCKTCNLSGGRQYRSEVRRHSLLGHGNGLRKGCRIGGATADMEGDALDGNIVLLGCRKKCLAVLQLCSILVAQLASAHSQDTEYRVPQVESSNS